MAAINQLREWLISLDLSTFQNLFLPICCFYCLVLGISLDASYCFDFALLGLESSSVCC